MYGILLKKEVSNTGCAKLRREKCNFTAKGKGN
jgi:hypothetical protein